MDDFDLDWDDFYQDSPLSVLSDSSAKVQLFSRIHHVDGLIQQFERITLMTKSQRSAWVSENKKFLQNIFDHFVSDSFKILDGVELDEEGIQLSIEFVTKLRDVMNMVQNILFEGKRLKG